MPEAMKPEELHLPEAAKGLTEKTSVEMAGLVQWMPVTFEDAGDVQTVASSYCVAGPEGEAPLVLLHGFDSSLLEFRRLFPLLAKGRRVYAVDLLGFGFCDRTAISKVTPNAIKLHLKAFCEQVIGQPVVLVGASMGGGAAIDFAVSFPQMVERLVLIDAVGFAAGPAIGRVMFPPLDQWATNFLRNPGVRRGISKRAYFDKSFVTVDAELCASLHLLMPDWAAALISFTKSGGYNFLSKQIKDVSQPTTVLWGRQDQILGTKDAARFEQTVPACELVWIDQCGHVPHLEQAEVTANAIKNRIPMNK